MHIVSYLHAQSHANSNFDANSDANTNTYFYAQPDTFVVLRGLMPESTRAGLGSLAFKLVDWSIRV